MRQKMLGDAIRLYVRNGRRDILLANLGPSEDNDYFSDSGRDVIYRLGDERGFLSVDSEWLLVWFNDHGETVKYEVWTD